MLLTSMLIESSQCSADGRYKPHPLRRGVQGLMLLRGASGGRVPSVVPTLGTGL